MNGPITIPRFAGTIILPSDRGYDQYREVWNASIDRRSAVIARCTSADDVAAAVLFGRAAGLEIAVKCGGHSMMGLSVPDRGLLLDLTPMNEVRVDPRRRRATVQGGALLRYLDWATEPHALATTAGNVSHTGVGGLTLGGGMGWLARQAGLACDNVEAYTVVTAQGETVRASATENADLFWGLRGGGGNFGIVTEFEFRLHPITGRALVAELFFDATLAAGPLRAWRDLLPDAPRQATLTADALTADVSPILPATLHRRPIVTIGFTWVGDVHEGRRYIGTLRQVGDPAAERVEEMTYVELQSAGDATHHHGKRRYMKGHRLTRFSDSAIDAFLSRGIPDGEADPDWSRVPQGGLQSYDGAIADVDDDASAFGHRNTLVEFGCGISWLDAAEDQERMAAARAYAAVVEPFASGVYVNVLADEGQAGVQRAYPPGKFARLAELKRRYDPDNVFHLNHNIPPADLAGRHTVISGATSRLAGRAG